MSPIDRIPRWNDEDARMWRAGIVSTTRCRLYALFEARGVMLLLAATAAIALVLLVVGL
jgi:hypothetical protein